MNITAYLHSAPPFRIVGGERMTLALLAHAQQNGHDITLVIQTYSDVTTYMGMRVVPALDKANMRNAFAQSDYIVTHPELAKHLHGDRLIGIVHNLNPGTLEQIKQHQWAALIANSHTTANNLKTLGVRYTHIIAPPLLEPQQLPPNRQFVLMSNLSAEKGAHVFYDAARALPQINFLGVLGGYNQQAAIALDNVTYMGHGPLDLAMANAKIIVSPSQTETYGMTIAEAAAAGVPAIVSDIPAHREVLGKAATYIPLDADQSAWTEAIRDYMTDNALYEQMQHLTIKRADQLEKQTEKTYSNWLTLLSMI